MLAIFLPLLIVLVLEIVAGLLLFAPRAMVTSVAKICKFMLSTTATSTFSLALLVPFLASLYEMGALSTNRSALSAGDVAKAQLLAMMSVCGVVLALILRQSSHEILNHESLKRSHEALLKQAKGLQEQYERLSCEQKESGSLTQKEKEALQSQAAAAEEARKSAETRVAAMVSQAKGMDVEYDRLLEENRLLKRQLAQQDPSYSTQGSKKDL